MLRARVAFMALVACGAFAPAAFAVGEKVDTKTKLSSTRITAQKPGKAKVSWEMNISTADGSRARSIHEGELLLPKSFYAVTSGLKSCPLAKLDANDVNSCPAKSIVGSAEATISTPEVRPEPFTSSRGHLLHRQEGQAVRPRRLLHARQDPVPAQRLAAADLPARKKKTKLNMDQVPVPVPRCPTPLRSAYSSRSTRATCSAPTSARPVRRRRRATASTTSRPRATTIRCSTPRSPTR